MSEDATAGEPASTAGLTLAHMHVEELTAWQLYEILRLRAAVFVVEQDCPYQDLDGRDLEPTTRHLFWFDSPTRHVAAYLRVLADDGERRVGRVVTGAQYRGRGLASSLLQAAVAEFGAEAMVLAAQARLEPWYERFGFTRCGPNFLEDGIVHVPMRRAGAHHRR